jgi:hypothetical protein
MRKNKMKKNILIPVVCFVLCLSHFANATIYVDNVALPENSLTISDNSYNDSIIKLTEESELYIYSYGFDVELRYYIQAFDNTSINIISDAPVLVMYNLMDMFWVYEDAQIRSPSSLYIAFWRQVDPKTIWEIADVYSPENAVINIFVPEPTTLILLSVAAPLILRNKRQS